MPLAPNLIERTLFLTANQGPGPMLDLWSGPAFWSIHAALKLGLFETLAQGAQSADRLAQALEANPNGVAILLQTLKALGYVRERNSIYSNTAMTEKWLLPTGSLNLTPIFFYWGALMEHFMPRLADSIRSGEDMDFYAWLEDQPEVSRNFQEGMIQIARFIARDIARALTLPASATRLLDVGGGHGEYSIALCRAHPHLSAVVLDGDQALVTGRAAIDRAGMTDRIQVQAGNFMQDALPGGFDVALVFNVVHGLKPAQNIDLFRKIRDALNPGGQLVVLEQVHNIAPLPMTNAVSTILSIAYYHLIGGQVYTAGDIQDWLGQAGFGTATRHALMKASSVLLAAPR